MVSLTGNIAPSRARPTMTGAYVLMAILGLVAVGLLLGAFSLHQRGGRASPQVVVLYSIGLGMAGLIVVYQRFARREVAEEDAEEQRRAQFPHEPWKWKREWQKPHLESDTAGGVAGLWIFALMWNGISAPGTWIILHDAHREPAANLILIFPAVGVLVLWAAIYQTMRWRKFGRTRFVPSTMPGAIGGYLGGVIEVPARVRPEADAKLTLMCVRRETSGSGKRRHTDESILWEREERIARDKWVTGPEGTRIPVQFHIPADCTPTRDNDGSVEVVWRLAAEAAVPGVDFATRFKVPVYATGKTAPAPAPGQPVLGEYRAPALEPAELADCGVHRAGDAYQFTTSHLSGTKATTAAMQLGIFALLGWFVGRDIPGPVWGVVIFFALIMGLITASVWFSRFELRLDGAAVVVTKPRPWGTTVTRVPRAQVQEVKFAKAMSSGGKQYYSLCLIGVAIADLGAAASPGEPFGVRKLRYQLAQLEKKGDVTPEQRKQMAAQIMVELKKSPTFIVPFAMNIPGQTRAEAIGAMVLEAIRGAKVPGKS